MIFNQSKRAVLAFLILTLITIVLARGLLFSPGTILYGDFISTLTKDKFIGVYYPTWTDNGEFNLNGLPRLAYLLVYSLPFYIFNLPADIYFKLLIASTLIIAGFSMYVLITNVLKKHVAGKELFICGIASAVLYAFNPWVMNRIQHRFLLTSYSILPLMFLFSFKALKDGKLNLKYSFVAAILFAIASTSIHSILFISILLLSLSIYLFFYLKQKKQVILNLLFLLALYFVFSLYWILPSIFYSTSHSLQPPYVDTIETVNLLSRNSNLLNVLGLVSYWNPKITIGGSILDISWRIVSLVIPVICFSAAFLYRKSRAVLCLSLLGIVTIFLSTGTNTFSYLYEQLCFNNLPLVGTFSWIFRDPDKWGFLLPFVYSVLTGLTFAALTNKFSAEFSAKRWRKLHFSPRIGRSLVQACVLVSILLFTIPIADIYLNQVIKPVPIPNEFYATNEWLANDSSIAKVAWLPELTGGGTTWAPESMIGPFDLYSSQKPAVGLSQQQSEYLFVYGLNALSNNRTEVFGKYLSALNIRYVVVRDDTISNKENASEIISDLKKQLDLDLAKQEGFIYIFENKNWSPNVFIPTRNFLVAGGLDTLTSANFISNFKPEQSALAFLEQGIYDTPSGLNDIILSAGKTDDLMFHFISEKQVIAPFDYTNHHDPSSLWSKAATNDPLHGEWHSYLEQNGIDNWDFDYGKGLVFTWATSRPEGNPDQVSLELPFTVSETGEYVFLTRLFQNQQGGEIQVQLDNASYTVNTRDQLNEFTWEQMGTLSLQEGRHEVTLTNVEGFNAVNLFALVPKEQFEAAQNRLAEALQDKRVVYVFEGENDFYSVNAVASNKFGGEASSGGVLELPAASEAWREFEVLKAGNYTFAIRSKGNLHITINGETYIINSDALDWNYIGPLTLESGKQTIEITSIPAHSGDHSDLDVVWLYSTQSSNETLEDVFATGKASAEVMSYQKIDSTKYVVTVNASAPFMLSFGEAYDPLWTAQVNGKRIAPVPLFSVVNGFWVDQTGVLDITIEYSPQEWFYYGSAVSVTGLIACVAYLTYGWAKNKSVWKKIKALITRIRLGIRYNPQKESMATSKTT
jgi:hypothetical protein